MLNKVTTWADSLREKSSNVGKGFRTAQVNSITRMMQFCIETIGAHTTCDAPEIRDSLIVEKSKIESSKGHLLDSKNILVAAELLEAAAETIERENLIKVKVNTPTVETSRALLRKLHDHDYFAVVDLEMTCEANGVGFKMETIEIGCAMVRTDTLEVVDTYESLVRPSLNPTLSKFCTELTGITQNDVDSARHFPEVANEFGQFLAKHRNALFVAWGTGDFKQIQQDCEMHDIDNPVQISILNQKSIFKSMGLTNKGFGLKKALNIAKIEQGEAHRALADAVNTAKLLPFMVGKAHEITDKAGGRKIVSEDRFKSVGKLLTYVLRHSPESVGVEMSPEGWVVIDDLLSSLYSQEKNNVTKAELFEIVELERRSYEEPDNPNLKALRGKKRFGISPDGKRVRCLQGHSTSKVSAIEYDLTAVVPELLYHGTSVENASQILEDKVIKPMERLQVHLSDNLDTASAVGKRHGKLHILTIDAKRMERDGCELLRSLNGVWLCDEVPTKYLHNPYV